MSAKLIPIVLTCALVCCNRAAQEDKVAREMQPKPLAEVPTDGPVPGGLEPALWQDIRSYPASSATISAFPNAQKLGFIISWLRELGRGVPGWPACVGEELDKVSRYYMVQSALPDGSIRQQSTLVFHGTFDQAGVTDCASQVLSAFAVATDMKGKVDSKGELTELSMGDGRLYVLWAKAGGQTMTVTDSDKAVVSGFLSNPAKLDPDGELVKLVAGMDRTGDLWSAGTMDFASNFLGTESTGYDLTVSFAGEPAPDSPSVGVRGQARLHFASEAEAAKAKAALDKFIEDMTEEDPKTEPLIPNSTGGPMPPARQVLNEVLTVTVDGSRLRLSFSADKDQLMVLMNKMAAVVERITGPQ